MTLTALYVSGNKILNAYGQQIHLHGVNKVEFADDPDGIWMNDTDWSDANVQAELAEIKAWGANLVRCFISVEDWKNDNDAPNAVIHCHDALKRLLTFADAEGLYVVIVGYRVLNYWNGGGQDPLPYPPYQSPDGSAIIADEAAFVAWWVSIADELKTYNNAIFELWNEPDGAGIATWPAVAQSCVTGIRAVGASNLIIYQYSAALYVNMDFPLTGPTMSYAGSITGGNIVYSTHLYNDGPSGWHILRSINNSGLIENYGCYSSQDISDGLTYMGIVAAAQNYPVIIGEIGADVLYSEPDLTKNLDYFRNSLALYNSLGFHYAVFWWREIGVYPLMSGAPTFTANTAGQIVKDAFAAAPVPAPINYVVNSPVADQHYFAAPTVDITLNGQTVQWDIYDNTSHSWLYPTAQLYAGVVNLAGLLTAGHSYRLNTSDTQVYALDTTFYLDPTPEEPPPPTYYNVSVAAGAGGSVVPSGSQSILSGSNFTATASASSGYVFVRWLKNSVAYSTDNSITLTITAATALDAEFSASAPEEPPAPPTPPASYFSVNIGVAVGGTTNPTGVQQVLTTSTLSVLAVPTANYQFDYWFKNGVASGSINPAVLSGVASETITLLPVFTYVPPQNPPVAPGGVDVVAGSGYLEAVLNDLEAVDVPSTEDIFVELEGVLL
jgi:hypothetical protein